MNDPLVDPQPAAAEPDAGAKPPANPPPSAPSADARSSDVPRSDGAPSAGSPFGAPRVDPLEADGGGDKPAPAFAATGTAGRTRRFWRIVFTLTPFVVAFLRDRRRWIVFGAPRELPAAVHARRARRLVDAVAGLGPTFIKLAQVFGARADILPEPYLSEVARLQDAVAPLPVEAIEAVILAEFGRPAAQVFEAFDRAPLAAASLGQVHRARAEGRDVAVKVIRPGVEELVAVDLDVSFRILWYLNVLFPNHHVRALTTVVREFEKHIREELDLRLEARSTEWFRAHFSGDARVRAPEVLGAFTRRRVLVTEFVHGTKVDRLHERFARGELSFPALMDTLVEAYLRMMLVDGTLHADPHAGNILVEADGTVVFLDFGMVVRIERATRERIFRLALAAARDDVEGIIAGMYELGMIDPDVSRSEIRDAAGQILTIVQRARDYSQRQIQEMVAEILDAFYTWPLMLPEELVYFFRASALLEGIGFRYDPGFVGMEAVKPVVERMRGELLRGMARDPQDVARGLLDEAQQTLRALHDVVRRAEREELRVRAHPRDLAHVERSFGLMVRRLLLGLFAAVVSLVSTLVFTATRSWPVLAVGNAAALFVFCIVLFIPKHLLENPLHRARNLRGRR
ncbi:MAG: hypothetical protein JWM27_3659 [Gemmatimonadetes bacterium]|nr:hypothetical protein [Gemmatimonadota bacterium]